MLESSETLTVMFEQSEDLMMILEQSEDLNIILELRYTLFRLRGNRANVEPNCRTPSVES